MWLRNQTAKWIDVILVKLLCWSVSVTRKIMLVLLVNIEEMYP